MEDEEVPLVDSVFEGALGELNDVDFWSFESFRNGSSSRCHGGLWWLIENEEDDEVSVDVRREVSSFLLEESRKHHIVGMREVGEEFRSRKIGMIWSFSVLRVCKSTKILFVCEDGLAIEWNFENLTELLERKSDEFILNHEGDKNDARVILLKSDLTIKVQNKARDNWLINFVETIETYVSEIPIDV
ncbi:hypothetical protein Tco_0031926 [Tanacetum coccineum]